MNNTSRTELSDGIFLTNVPDKKFNTNLISIGFICPLSKDTASEIALLPQLLRRAGEKYPDMLSVENALATLYGARIEPYVRKRGEILSAGFICDVIDESLVNGKSDLIKNLISMVCSLITEPLIKDGGFLPELVESEKEKLCDRITSELNDKRSYSVKKMLEAMCSGEAFAVSSYGTLEDVRRITPDRLYSTYKNMLSSAPLEIFCCGRADKEELVSYFKSALKNIDRHDVQPIPTTVLHQLNNPVKNETEVLDVIQSKLVMGFNTGITASDKRYPALILANAILGSGTTSKLFMNVREKMSLCYYASSSLDKQKGILVVSSGINFSDFEAARDEIMHQLTEVQNGNITKEELSNAKLTVISAYRSIEDSAAEIEGFLSSQMLSDCNYSLSDLIDKISEVTMQEIIDVSSEIVLDTIYLLTGKEDSNE